MKHGSIFKKLTSLVLAALMLLPTVACATSTENPEETTAPTGTDAVIETETDIFPAVEKTDYEGETFRMIGLNEPGSWYYADEISSEQGNTHVLNNTIYEMNSMVEEYLGITIEYEQVTNVRTGGEVFDTVRPSIQSGDDIYQLCILHPYYSYNSFISQGYAMDFYSLPDLDLDKPYWNREVMEQLSINDHAYIGFGDLCSYTLDIFYCNKDMFKRANLTVPYDLVRNGKWTIDAFTSLTTNLYVDNGDGKRDKHDTYGIAALWDANASTFMQGSGIYVATRTDEGFELSLYGDRLTSLYDKLLKWSKDESTYLWSFGNNANTDITVNFLDATTYMTFAPIGAQYLEADFDFGMLPMPKYDEAQEEYAHVNWGNNLVLPTTIKNKDMVGKALEMIAYYSRTLVQTTYYDNVLQLRVSEAPDDREMVELIYNTVVFDPGIAYCDGHQQLWNLVYLPTFTILDGKDSIASYYKQNERGAKRSLEKIFQVKEPKS